MTTTQKQALFSALHQLTDSITSEKTAALRAKQSESPTPADPGGYMGATTHPSKSVDNRGQVASEGSRSAENVSDVKADQGSPGVDSTSPANEGSMQDKVQLNIGTQQSATGEDPAVEDNYKDTKEDSETSHPASTENDALDGHKYASVSFQATHDLAEQLANGILADLANGQQLTKSATQNAKTAADQTDPDVAAGYELARLCGVDKTAADQLIEEQLAAIIKEAHDDADLLGAYLQGLREKKSMEESPDDAAPESSEDHSNPGDATSGAGDSDGGGDAGGGGGGDGGGIEAILAGGGGDPAMGGGPPPGGPGMGGDPGMGGGGDEAAMMELLAALEEMGITPEELAQFIDSSGGGGGPEMGGGPPMGGGDPARAGGDPGMGGPPPMGGEPSMGGGPPPMGGPEEGAGMKLASALKRFKRSGRYKFKAADDGTKSREMRDRMKGYLQELLPAR
jgi:hypothetical protein